MRQKIGGGQWPSGKARLYGGLPAGSAGSSPACSFVEINLDGSRLCSRKRRPLECSSVWQSSKAIKLQVPGSSPGTPFPGRVVPPVKVKRPKLRRNIQVFARVRQSSVLRGCRRTGRIVIRCISRVAIAATTTSKAACGQRDAGPISLSFHYFPLSAILSACRWPLAGVDQYAADLTAEA